MGISYNELTLRHPCFAKEKKGETGRIHLPISPGCNIECKFCDRQINDFEKRPGVTSKVISPEEAIDVIRRSLALCQVITVAGIAGPGDTLATPYALETFRLIKKEFPELIKCMSTNGLLLVEKADEIIEVGIDSLTVTVNAVNPEIEALLNGGITYHGKHYLGVKGAEILIKNQLEGIKKVSSAGITVKVNTVLVPSINENHIEEIARTVHEAGASIYNIIPLIPQHELADCSAPTCAQIDSTRQLAEKHIDVFRHCQRCRADAIGVPGGEDFGEKIYLKRMLQKDTFSHG
ncbi:radical SAM protein [Anaerotignum propionicum]|uniref:radical SAM protein n=1 Tax=Anaerotignum propionicum TaxID=28446 RepID=UPI00210EFD46|nr:radical SAM protein [Anaerotignum propionicum]MCQ4936405.1 radical SAM protein [Anaerotignum propionicum]